MNITELALYKKMFGGGGGKREGTAIPYGQPVERIYFNTENTKEETDALLSQLTYVEGILNCPVHFIYANTLDGNVGNFIFVMNTGTGYEITLLTALTETSGAKEYTIYASNSDVINNGWWTNGDTVFTHNSVAWMQTLWVPNSMEVIHSGETLTEFMGVPIGTENEKIKNVLSITPF